MLQLKHNDYQVGWICALPKEQTAATAMLDVRHANLPKPRTDPNVYTLGAIGDHNVVISCLQKGRYGTVSASVVAANMASTFPNIRFGLMVGIGGGIPPKVRLGDVVVSVPVGQYSGVVQWDLGKAEEGGTFRRAGSLNNPPTSLLTVLTRLQTEHELMGPEFPQYLQELATKFPNLASSYATSDQLQDILFDKDYPHASCMDDNGQNDSCASCDQGRSVKRKPRGVQVHYGLIASGNQVIKDAKLREQLVKEFGNNLLCVEMEAAGLMDSFPCLVIRGICDYADSHKNKAWQEYAAAVAAAFTKELLGYVTVAEVTEEQAAKDVISHIDQTFETIKEAISDTRQLLYKKDDMEILTWLAETHYGARQSDHLRQWYPNTGRWFLDSKAYHDWFRTEGKALYCPGIPGSGKTVMSAAVIHNLSHHISSNPNIGLAYIYFTFSQQREQTIEHILASLLMQFLHRQTSIPNHVRKLHGIHKGNGTRPSHDELFDHLKLVLSEYERAFIVLDALDECGTYSQCRSRVLHDIRMLQLETGVNILVTSRMVEEIAHKFRHHQDSLVLQIMANEADMQLVSRSQIETHDHEFLDDSSRQEIASKVAQIAQGMFLLAQLHLNAIFSMPTRGKIKRALGGLTSGPAGLYDVYEMAMTRIESQGCENNVLAKSVLSWIVHARTPLSPTQLQHALSVTPNARLLDEDDIPSMKMLQSVCAGLVAIDMASNTIRLVHYTTREYFERTREKWFPDAQRQITQTCLTFLTFPLFSLPCDYREFLNRRRHHPFYDFAVSEWMHHAKQTPAIQEVIEFLLRPDKETEFLASSMSCCGGSLRPYSKTTFTGLRKTSHVAIHFAIHFSLDYASETLLCRHDVLDDCDWNSMTMAHAIQHGRVAVVNVILRVTGMDINHKDALLMTPLAWAVEVRQAEIARLLLATGRADVNSKNGEFDVTPLTLAVRHGYEDMVQLLLEIEGVDVNSKDQAGQTPLALAIKKHHTAVVEVLLNSKAVNFNSKDQIGRTPLAIAANLDYEVVVKMLLATGQVDINGRDQLGQTPLAISAVRGYETVVQLLLKTGRVDRNSKNRTGQTPLELAATNGHAKVVKMLLMTGKSGVGRKWAAAKYQKIVQLMFDIGKMSVSSGDGIGRIPMTVAMRDHLEVDAQLDRLRETYRYGKLSVGNRGGFRRIRATVTMRDRLLRDAYWCSKVGNSPILLTPKVTWGVLEAGKLLEGIDEMQWDDKAVWSLSVTGLLKFVKLFGSLDETYWYSKIGNSRTLLEATRDISEAPHFLTEIEEVDRGNTTDVQTALLLGHAARAIVRWDFRSGKAYVHVRDVMRIMTLIHATQRKFQAVSVLSILNSAFGHRFVGFNSKADTKGGILRRYNMSQAKVEEV